MGKQGSLRRNLGKQGERLMEVSVIITTYNEEVNIQRGSLVTVGVDRVTANQQERQTGIACAANEFLEEVLGRLPLAFVG